MMPSNLAMVDIEALPVASPKAKRENSRVSDPKTNCNALLSFKVPTNMTRVKRPHTKR